MKRNYFKIALVLLANFTILNIIVLIMLTSQRISLEALFIAIYIINSIVAFIILSNRKSYEEKLTWILIILFFPISGLIFYLFFGLDYSLIRKNRGNIYNKDRLLNAQHQTLFSKEFTKQFDSNSEFIELINNLTKKPIRFYNKTTLLNNGDEFFPKLFEELEKAEQYIHLEYFIIKNSDVAKQLFEILIRKAKAGVEVRCLFDYFGALKFGSELQEELISNGGEVYLFNSLSMRTIFDGLNYRNHRKITVIDGKIGFTGGINISDEYNHKDKYYGYWRDTHLMIEGDAVKSLHIVFIKDWYYTTSEDLLQDKYLVTHRYQASNGNSGVQILDDGPDNPRSILKDVYFKAIMEAQTNVRIATPYLIPDSELLEALKVSAMSGIKVQIIVPGKPDKKLVYQATMSYFEELLECGCEIYFYGKNFMHSKILVIDDKIASVGTTNIDFRSFLLNFENTAILYNDETIKNIIHSFNVDLEVSIKVEYNDWKQRSYHKRFVETFARLFSPLF